MKVFVTGATGFVGSRVVRKLLSQKYEVVGLCRTEEQVTALKNIGVHPVIGDVRNPEGIAKIAKECDATLHLAFIHDLSIFDEAVKIDTEVMRALMKAYEGTEKKLIITSGTLIAGPTKPGEKKDDSLDFNEINGIARACVEIEALSLCKKEGEKEREKKGVDLSVVRLPPFVYGSNGAGLAKFMIEAAKKSGFFCYIGEGEEKTTTGYVEDVADCFILSLKRGKRGQAYHAVGETVSYKDLATALGKSLGIETKSITKEESNSILGPLLSFILSNSHEATGSVAARDLGFNPKNKPTIFENISDPLFKEWANSL